MIGQINKLKYYYSKFSIYRVKYLYMFVFRLKCVWVCQRKKANIHMIEYTYIYVYRGQIYGCLCICESINHSVMSDSVTQQT